jgi:aldehyde:ferredoxin oxidoreductase
MAHGFTGKILHVDLSEGRHWVEEPDDAFYRKMMGGRALVAHYLLTLVPPGADPLGPENIFVMAPGIVTGSTFSGQGRNGVGSKSPLTGGLGSAEAGGYAGAELKRAGFDAVVVRGKAAKPSYVWIKDGAVEIRDGSAVWGLDIADAEKKIREEVGDKTARTTLIGPGGENLVRFACVVNDVSHFAGRTGVGAVMGSKNLKGLAIKARDREPGPDLALPRRRDGRRAAGAAHGRRPADLQLPGRRLRRQREDHRHDDARHDPDQAGHVLRLRRPVQAGGPG